MIKDVREVWAESWIKEARKKKVWKPKEIARLFGIHYNTVLSWIKYGKLKALVITDGRFPYYRVHQEDLIEFIKERHSYVYESSQSLHDEQKS